jgi:hypothetical protein
VAALCAGALQHHLEGVRDLLEGSTNILIVLCAALLAIGAAVAGVRYHGDFERFAQRSKQTSEALKRVAGGLTEFEGRCAAAGDGHARLPLFETLQAIVMDLEHVLVSDLSDWRFVYRSRPAPEPG